jgi:hypothetical protein
MGRHNALCSACFPQSFAQKLRIADVAVQATDRNVIASSSSYA